MGKISRHFTRGEMACRCGCGFDSMDIETLDVADGVRDFADIPITPTSCCRCLKYNKSVGSNDKSQHTKARAMDLPVPYPKEIYDYLCQMYPDEYGFGLYKTFVHIDTRSGYPARWID